MLGVAYMAGKSDTPPSARIRIGDVSVWECCGEASDTDLTRNGSRTDASCMAYIRIFIGLLGAAVVLSGNAGGQGQLDLKDPKVRKMIQEERKSMDCAGIYQQTKLKLDKQFKLVNKFDPSPGLGSQLMSPLTQKNKPSSQC